MTCLFDLFVDSSLQEKKSTFFCSPITLGEGFQKAKLITFLKKIGNEEQTQTPQPNIYLDTSFLMKIDGLFSLIITLKY